MRRKIGINSECINNENPINTIEKIKNIGFDSFFSVKYKREEVEKLKNKGDALGLDFEFIHAPFKEINSLWGENNDELPIYNAIKESIDSASSCGIKKIILHVSSGWEPPAINQYGLARYDSIVEYADKKGVQVAFENLRRADNLDFMMQRYKNVGNVAFCYDCGHEHCYTETVSLLDLYGNRLSCVHIHDNHGRDKIDCFKNNDEHLLPFDGSVDYKKVVENLDKVGYSGSIMLEVYSAPYTTLSADEFLSTAKDRAIKIEKMGK